MYAGSDDFLPRVLPFVREGLALDEPQLIAVDATKIRQLRSALGQDADRVRFADMMRMGRNPAAIIPVWQEFVDEHVAAGRGGRGIGEPVWAERSHDELVECRHHESLLNLAFQDSPEWTLLCPYDTSSLSDAALETAACSHPVVAWGSERQPSSTFCAPEDAPSPFSGDLPMAPSDRIGLEFARGELANVRWFVLRYATTAGVAPTQAEDLVLAVNEIATNSLRHGGGRGMLRAWVDATSIVVEVLDAGHIQDPLAGRVCPKRDQVNGRGLWMVNHLCDLVQIRSGPTGNVVRLHMRRQ